VYEKLLGHDGDPSLRRAACDKMIARAAHAVDAAVDDGCQVPTDAQAYALARGFGYFGSSRRCSPTQGSTSVPRSGASSPACRARWEGSSPHRGALPCRASETFYPLSVVDTADYLLADDGWLTSSRDVQRERFCDSFGIGSSRGGRNGAAPSMGGGSGLCQGRGNAAPKGTT
jgi:hypothetical protein